jgi:hypothetical protein
MSVVFLVTTEPPGTARTRSERAAGVRLAFEVNVTLSGVVPSGVLVDDGTHRSARESTSLRRSSQRAVDVWS